jgi:7-carboxy-7-deazaguanine synthase
MTLAAPRDKTPDRTAGDDAAGVPVRAPVRERLRITEIFHSLQGEARDVGRRTVFVRLTGCPLRCSYCDTEYAFHGGEWYELDRIMAEVERYATPYVCVTGGEPLAQKRCLDLLRRLCDAGYQVSLETSGALDITEVDRRVSRVLDVKTPDSGECERNLWSNFTQLTPHDQVKFVIGSRADFEWSRAKLAEHELGARCEVLFSPSHGRLAPSELADWILAERLPVRMQVQLHKVIWGDVPGR